VHGTGFTVHDRDGKFRFPLGVAFTLRRAKSKAPALHCRAESPATISTGQRPVKTGVYRQPALKGHNPAIDSMSPFQGLTFAARSTPRVTPSASPAVMHNPALAGRSGGSAVKSRRDGTLLTVCFSLRIFSLRAVLLSALMFFFCANLHARVTIGVLSYTRCVLSYTRCALSYTKCVLSYTKCVLSYTKCALSYTRYALSYTRYALSYTRCALSYTRYALSYTRYALSYTKYALSYTKYRYYYYNYFFKFKKL
jgi:hypothetical protein